MNSETRSAIRQLALANHTISDISDKLGIPYATVYCHCKTYKVKTAHRYRSSVYLGSRTLNVLAAVFRNPEKSDVEHADDFKCTREYVGQIRGWMKKNGVKK